MNKAFIFDLDGVLIDDEAIWESKKQELYQNVFGSDITEKLGSTVGINIDGIYERATELGSKVDKEEFTNAFQALADDIYQHAPIPEGINELASYLTKQSYRLGIVSASPLPWITTVTKRLGFESDIELIISLYDRDDLQHKPHPDGYLEAIETLGAFPESTVILEDSNSGIRSAKASGAFTIGLRQNLVEGYEQTGADKYADSLKDVVKIVDSLNK